MSTFKGYVKEFPGLAIDYFRPRSTKEPPVHVNLLSHSHSDHLGGLENKSFGGAFIYCSRATKNILLMTQDVQSRTKYARGEIDCPKYKYRHLSTRHDLLRVLEYNTPTTIQIGRDSVLVTMLDANHCPGSAMFLIENDAHAILYTGDMRAEPSFLQTFLRNPLMAAYTTRQRRLDCIYLDTSARINGPAYPSKFQACADLVRAVSLYPPDTTFYFNARCTGYEDVWVALHRAFGVCIHVDRYRKELYAAASRDWAYGSIVDENFNL